MTTISIDDINELRVGYSCLQSNPCWHGVALITKDGKLYSSDKVGGPEVVRILSTTKCKKSGTKLNHFHNMNFMKQTNEAHMKKEPIKFGTVTLTYPRGFKPKPIKIREPVKRVPKATKSSASANEFLKKHGIYMCRPVSMEEAKSIVYSLCGHL